MKKVIILVIIMILVVFCFTGCEKSKTEYTRFEVIEEWGNGFTTRRNFMFYDKETGVVYYAIDNVGIIILYDKEGKPVIYKGE